MYIVLRSHSKVLLLKLCLLLGFLPVAVVSAAEPALNINTASPNQLAQTLPGIGPAKAKAIVAYREENGLFQSIEALIDVKGIGPKTLDKIRHFLFIGANDATASTNLTTAPRVSTVRRTQAHTDKINKRAVQALVSIARGDKPRVQRSHVLRQ